MIELVLFRDSLLPRPENGPEPRREKRETLPFLAWVQAHFQGEARGSPGTGLVADQQFSLKKNGLLRVLILGGSEKLVLPIIIFQKRGHRFRKPEKFACYVFIVFRCRSVAFLSLNINFKFCNLSCAIIFSQLPLTS